jgi:hypothetical protein
VDRRRPIQHALTLAPDQPFVLNYSLPCRHGPNRHADDDRQGGAAPANDSAIVDSLGWVMLRRNVPEAVRTLERWSDRKMRRSTTISATPTGGGRKLGRPTSGAAR